MAALEFLSRLDGVRSYGAGKWSARCPAHADKSPSLSIREGERGWLVKCWAGCSLPEICASLGIEQRELFFDDLDATPRQRQAAAQRREQDRRRRDAIQRADGFTIDALRKAERFIESRHGLDISNWSNAELDTELNALADAYSVLEVEHGR